jgi:hypothetical protein
MTAASERHQRVFTKVPTWDIFVQLVIIYACFHIGKVAFLKIDFYITKTIKLNLALIYIAWTPQDETLIFFIRQIVLRGYHSKESRVRCELVAFDLKKAFLLINFDYKVRLGEGLFVKTLEMSK